MTPVSRKLDTDFNAAPVADDEKFGNVDGAFQAIIDAADAAKS